MAANKLVFDPTQFFALQDIALWTTSLSRDADYETAVHLGKCSVQTRHDVEPRLLNVVMEGEEDAKALLRVLVSFGIRAVHAAGAGDRDAEDAQDNAEGAQERKEQVLYTLEACFAVDYEVLQAPEESDFFKFLERNCVHQAWPFWRAHVYDTLKRASLPVPVVPLMSGAHGGKKRKRVGRITSRDLGASVADVEAPN
jgi:hypothetical protein